MGTRHCVETPRGSLFGKHKDFPVLDILSSSSHRTAMCRERKPAPRLLDIRQLSPEDAAALRKAHPTVEFDAVPRDTG